jgi:hypothetical protein
MCRLLGSVNFLKVQALAHFLAGLEIRNALRRDLYRIAGAGIAALPGIAIASRKGAEAAQLDTAATLQLVDDRIVKSGHNPFNLFAREIGVVFAQLLHKLGTDQCTSPKKNFEIDVSAGSYGAAPSRLLDLLHHIPVKAIQGRHLLGA